MNIQNKLGICTKIRKTCLGYFLTPGIGLGLAIFYWKNLQISELNFSSNMN